MFASRLSLLPLVVLLLVYPPVAYIALKFSRARNQFWVFSLVNVVGAYVASIAAIAVHVEPTLLNELRVCAITGSAFLVYIVLVGVNYWLLRSDDERSSWAGYAIVLFPIASLILIKDVPQVQSLFPETLKLIGLSHISALFLGLSYVTFRMVHLSQQVRNKVAEMPSLIEYLNFAFFVPTFTTGPISWYSTFSKSLKEPDRAQTPVIRSIVRIIVGFTKYMFLSTLASQLAYGGLLRDGHPHHKIDLVIAAYAYTVYLFCNFSGFCDMVIAVSGLLGIEIMENFNQPFHARNFQDFWNRWHITLSLWLRDLLFTPLVKVLVRFFGPKSINHAIAASIITAFFLIGLWHGFGISFALFGLSQGLGVAVVHYYNSFLKKKLGKAGYLRYRANKAIQTVTTAMTISYFTASLFLFANNWEQVHEVLNSLI